MPRVPPYDIKTLINQMAEGDERAFQALFDDYKERFYAAAFKLIHSADQTEEVVQEVFVTIWVKRELIALSEKPESYLFTILQNSIYAHFRKIVQERRHRLKISGEDEVIEDSVEAWLIEKEKRSVLEEVISKLPSQQKIIYQLSKQHGMSREEIAKQLNISPNTVRNHLAAAVAFLRSWLQTNESALGWILLFLSFHCL